MIRQEPKPVMPPKLVLHIGHRKSGSSSIQQALAREEVRLADKTILYPCRVNHNYLRRHVDTFGENGEILADRKGMPNLERLERLISVNPAARAACSTCSS